MSGGPQFGPRHAQPLDLMVNQAGGDGFAGIEKLMNPVIQPEKLQPADEVARSMAKIFNMPGGREIFEWMMDISVRQRLQTSGISIEEVALRATKKEGIDGFAAAILAAIAHGQKLLEEGQK
ncbi:hypothetical protein [Roseibium album]|uniref:hypothetical protein n=1 Tax=Roseibium album TaxID=311410 RepID=UPI00248FBA0F|nr:hypothetical protein [Roseibium album]